MESSARPKLTVEEVDGGNQTQPVYPHPEQPQSFVPNTAPVQYAGDPASTATPGNSARPQLFGQPIPPSQPLYQQSVPTVVKKSPSDFGIEKLKFIIPAALLIVALVASAIFIPKYLERLNRSQKPIPEPTLSPATPVPTPDVLPRTETYFNVDKEITFQYLSSFTLVECDNKIAFTLTRPASQEEVCNQEHVGVLEILIADEGLTTPFEGFENALNKNIQGNENNYLVVLLMPKYENLFNKIVETVRFVDPNITEGWERYLSSSGYTISYPPEWTLIPAEEREGTNVSEIRKNVTETKLHNLAIKVTPNVANAGLSASEIISSLQGLSGWKERPNVEFRVIGGESAHVLQGEYEGVWKTNVVVWRGTSLVEMTWQDEIPQPERATFEGLLSTFAFTR